MPRDSSAVDEVQVVLPGGRVARVVPGDSAGQFKAVVDGSQLDHLFRLGHLNRDEYDAGTHLAALLEEASTRPRVTGGYDGPGDRSSEYFLERLDHRQLAAWRRLGRLLAVIPPECRQVVEDVCLWEQRPQSLRRLRHGLSAIHATLHGRRSPRP